jgi:hypothetical protein
VSDLPDIDITDGNPAAIRQLRALLDSGAIPGTYVSAGGELVLVEELSAAPGTLTGHDDAPVPVVAAPLKSAGLALLLAHEAYVHRYVASRDTHVEVTPPGTVLSAVLESRSWPKLRPLAGVIGAPVLRADGTLLQVPGYDKQTGLYLAPKVQLAPVPDNPSEDDVRAVREFLFNVFLGDFPWVSVADMANYVGLLVTPVLRGFLRTLIPFSVITSTTPGSGKTILTSGLGMLYGQRVLTWTHSDDELRKSITSVLADPVGTVIFDNLPEGGVIDSPVLARLITDRTWSDRLLGGNKTASMSNDRVWTSTGNNLRLGGDMRSRTVLVGLDPAMPDPDKRTGFAIPDLDSWILQPENQRLVMHHVLVLVADWVQAGAPRKSGLMMRQFSAWAQAVGGFTEHHGLPGFLGNADMLAEADEDEEIWTRFYRQWRELHGDNWVTAADVRKSADVAPDGTDRWRAAFPADAKGYPVSVKSLGRLLTGQLGRHRGAFVLRSQRDSHANARVWRVECTNAATV